MFKFKVGDRVRALGVDGIVKEIEGREMFIKRFDGVGGPAWKGTPQEGLWWADVNTAILTKRAVTVLENK